jgi:hypothetical protein
MVQGQTKQKVGKTSMSIAKANILVHACHSSFAVGRRIVIQVGPEQKCEDGGVIQVVEHLPGT